MMMKKIETKKLKCNWQKAFNLTLCAYFEVLQAKMAIYALVSALTMNSNLDVKPKLKKKKWREKKLQLRFALER